MKKRPGMAHFFKKTFLLTNQNEIAEYEIGELCELNLEKIPSMYWIDSKSGCINALSPQFY